MTTYSITGSITTNDPISASYALTASTVLNPGTSGINGMAYFTASTVWNVPAGISNVKVIAIGAGGHGAPGASGGGGGGYAEGIVNVEGYNTLPITVGSATSTNGNSSGFLYITASGGQYGINGGGIANGGSGINGNINSPGQAGDTNGGGASGNLPWIVIFPTTIQNSAVISLGSIGSGGYGVTAGVDGAVTIYY